MNIDRVLKLRTAQKEVFISQERQSTSVIQLLVRMRQEDRSCTTFYSILLNSYSKALKEKAGLSLEVRKLKIEGEGTQYLVMCTDHCCGPGWGILH